jgi:hypothetical protein
LTLRWIGFGIRVDDLPLRLWYEQYSPKKGPSITYDQSEFEFREALKFSRYPLTFEQFMLLTKSEKISVVAHYRASQMLQAIPSQ